MRAAGELGEDSEKGILGVQDGHGISRGLEKRVRNQDTDTKTHSPPHLSRW